MHTRVNKPDKRFATYRPTVADFCKFICLLIGCCTNAALAAAPEFQYLQLAGSTFHPVDSDANYGYSGKGCISKTGGTQSLFAHKVVLPQGATVKFLRIYAYDKTVSPSDRVTAFFTSYDMAGGFTQHTNVGSINDRTATPPVCRPKSAML